MGLAGRSFVLHDKITISMVNATALEVFTVVGKIDTVREQGIRIAKMKMAVVVSNKTDAEYPILYGLAMGGLSSTDIQECLAADPTGFIQAEETERSNRKVYPMGMFPRGGVDELRYQPMRFVRFPWKEIPEGTGLTYWAQNFESAVQTGDPVLEIAMVMTGEWLRD